MQDDLQIRIRDVNKKVMTSGIYTRTLQMTTLKQGKEITKLKKKCGEAPALSKFKVK